jgi:hypothetical protein
MIIVSYLKIINYFAIIDNINFKETENDKVGGSNWTQVKVNGDVTPGPRKGHTMVYYQHNIYLYGGETDNGLYENSFYKYDIAGSFWTLIKLHGVNPGCRAYHTMDFFKKDILIIFGGKLMNRNNNISVTETLMCIDLKNLSCSNPFVSDLGPSPRFGHKAAYNQFFNKGSREFLHSIVGGVDTSYCSMDIFTLKEIEINESKKWVYSHKNQHNTQKIDGSDEVFEIAKKTIIQYKKKLDEAVKENNNINKIFSENSQTLYKYDSQNKQDSSYNSEKKNQMEQKKSDIEKEKREITSKSRELKDYNNLLNNFCNLHREKYLTIIEFLTMSLKDIHEIDKFFEYVNGMEKNSRVMLFSDVNLDSLTVKRRNYKTLMSKFLKNIKEYSLFEKSIYDDIVKIQNNQKEKFKNMFFIIDDKQQLCFKEKEKEIDFSTIIVNDNK